MHTCTHAHTSNGGSIRWSHTHAHTHTHTFSLSLSFHIHMHTHTHSLSLSLFSHTHAHTHTHTLSLSFLSHTHTHTHTHTQAHTHTHPTSGGSDPIPALPEERENNFFTQFTTRTQYNHLYTCYVCGKYTHVWFIYIHTRRTHSFHQSESHVNACCVRGINKKKLFSLSIYTKGEQLLFISLNHTWMSVACMIWIHIYIQRENNFFAKLNTDTQIPHHTHKLSNTHVFVLFQLRFFVFFGHAIEKARQVK